MSRIKCHNCHQLGHMKASCPNNSKGRSYYHGDRNNNVGNSSSNKVQFDYVTVPVYFSQHPGASFQPVAILDSGCTKTVAGSTWVDNFVHLLHQQRTSDKVTFTPTDVVLCFGRDIRPASRRAIVPVWIAGKQGTITIEVVDETPGEPRLPLLLSKSVMAKLKIKIDYESDDATVLGSAHQVDDQCQGSHYVLHLLDDRGHNNPGGEEVLAVDPEHLTKSGVERLHKRFGHPGSDRLLNTLQKAGVPRSDVRKLVEQVTEECPTCMKNGRPTSRPIVCAPLSSDFNDLVSIDIAYFEGHPFLKVIDVFSRYAVAVPLPDKTQRSLIDALDQCWFTYFGPMRRILGDPAGENTGDVFLRFCDSYSIQVLPTAAQAPFSDGIVERFGETLKETMRKLKADSPKHDLRTLLNKATLAHNSLDNTTLASRPCRSSQVRTHTFHLP
jgi:hypothetical protein